MLLCSVMYACPCVLRKTQPLVPGSAAALMDVHFRLLRNDFVEPLREAVLGYRREKLKNINVGAGVSECMHGGQGAMRE